MRCSKQEANATVSPGKSLGKFAEAVQRVEVGRLAVPRQGITVQPDPLDQVTTRLGKIPAKQRGFIKPWGKTKDNRRNGTTMHAQSGLIGPAVFATLAAATGCEVCQ